MHRHFFALFFSIVVCTLAGAKDLDIRIGIIGGGPSGLVAAGELKDKGYKNVTVLEANNEVGGKVKTLYYQGLPYEMGAVVTAPDYEITLGIAKELHEELHPTPTSLTLSRDGGISDLLDWTKEELGIFRHSKMLAALTYFSAYVLTNEEFFRPGYDRVPAELLKTFEDFMVDGDMETVLNMFRPMMVGCGYGFAEHQPAPYWLKLMRIFAHEYTWSIFSHNNFYRSFDSGWQNLFRKYVERNNLDVRLNSKVTLIETQN